MIQVWLTKLAGEPKEEGVDYRSMVRGDLTRLKLLLEYNGETFVG
jgi:hypothetical protein